MPRERTEFIRISNVEEREKMFLLAYEGNETEPTYFEALKNDYRFNNDIIELISLKRDKNDTKSAPKYVFENLKAIKDEYDLAKSDELWMIIDRDRNRGNIDKYYRKCESEQNFFFALSNPCFELWLLLHIKELSDFTEDDLKKILENRKVSSKKTHLKKILSDILPDGYNESNLQPKRFLSYLELAIERAKVISNPNEPYPVAIGTDIFKLVEKIIKKNY